MAKSKKPARPTKAECFQFIAAALAFNDCIALGEDFAQRLADGEDKLMDECGDPFVAALWRELLEVYPDGGMDGFLARVKMVSSDLGRFQKSLEKSLKGKA